MSDFEEFCLENNLNVILSGDMKIMPKGFCYYYDDQYYVILNNRHSFQQLQQTTIHEIIHILEDHFSRPSNMINVCEKEVDGLISNLYDNFVSNFI